MDNRLSIPRIPCRMLWMFVALCVVLEGGCAAKRAYNRGIDAATEGQYAKAILSYKKAVAKDPAFAAAHYNMASCYAKLELYDNAIASYEKALECQPDMQDAIWNLALVLGKAGRLEEANQAWDKARSLCRSPKDAGMISVFMAENERKIAEKAAPPSPEGGP